MNGIDKMKNAGFSSFCRFCSFDILCFETQSVNDVIFIGFTNRFGLFLWSRIFFQRFFEISRYCFWNVDYPNRKCFHHFKQWKHFRSLRKSTPISQFYDQFRMNHFKWYFSWILLNVIFLVSKTGGLFLRFPRNTF